MHMTIIRATCPTCGDVEMKPKDLRLRVCTRADWSTYAFNCPTCTDEVKKPADEEIVALLMGGGVKATPWHIPAEALEAHEGLPLTYDDLLDLALELKLHDALAGIVQPASRH
jgi:endogenous inhibitor of DNA gyrase (YacG/DUF329 family)